MGFSKKAIRSHLLLNFQYCVFFLMSAKRKLDETWNDFQKLYLFFNFVFQSIIYVVSNLVFQTIIARCFETKLSVLYLTYLSIKTKDKFLSECARKQAT